MTSRLISVAIPAILASGPSDARAGETPEMMIKVGGGFAAAALSGQDFKVFASELKPGEECLSESPSAGDGGLPDLEGLIESGGKDVRDGAKPADFNGEKFVRISSFPGRHTLKFGLKKSVITINGEGSGYGHLILEAAGGSITFDKRTFRGRMELVASARDGLAVVNRIPIEDYLKGMLGSEMSHSWPLAALKAQAVAARSYAVHQRYFGGKCHYHVESSVIDQVYTGLQKEEISTIQAVADTAGEVLSYGGEPALALFHSCCGGQTRDIAEVFGKPVPYLKGRKCGFDSACPLFRWKRTVPLEKLGDALKKAGLLSGALDSVSIDERGRAVLNGSRKIRTDQLRRAVGYNAIPGGWFTVSSEVGQAVFSGRGSGHGVGMCQYGAKGMAEAGWDYRKILGYYFSGAELIRMY
ncbi:MAG: SpoIID/LytB domain-containing protein [Deltaproteobacteria bacterium]|nr:SpoIID/LytB domain-containing protein [Deltaproteobacteria bacterium]